MKRMLIAALCLGILGCGCAAGAASTASSSAAAAEAVPAETAVSAEITADVAADEEFTTVIFAMDTYMELRAYGPAAEDALAQVAADIQTLDSLLSVTDASSEIYAVNNSGGAAVSVSEDTAALLQRALALGESTGGALALTIYPVSRCWGFTTGEYQIPTQTELDALLAWVDDSQVTVADGAVTLPDQAELDLGAVAKGYAGDQAAETLRAAGVTSALLNLGSSTIRTLGQKPDGSNWRIAILDPLDNSAYAGVVELGEGAVDTSGGYERYFEGEDGQVYWHILDPETGAPAHSGLVSVTIISDNAFLGDGLSTALFVMGLEDAVAYWRENGGFEFVLIDEDGGMYVSEGACFEPLGSYADAQVTVIPYEE